MTLDHALHPNSRRGGGFRPTLLVAAALAVFFCRPATGAAEAACYRAPSIPAQAQFRGEGWPLRKLELLRRQPAHRFAGSVGWKLGPDGVQLCRGAVRSDAATRFRIALIGPVWQHYGAAITAAARRHGVPAELILTAIIEESGGKAGAIVRYRGYVSDGATPQRISVGIGQMLLSTAQRLAGRRVTRAWMLKPENAIDLVARYFALVYRQTGFDPPLAAAVYNGGSLRVAAGNRWSVANAGYVESFVAVFNASVAYLAIQADRPRVSFASLFALEASN
jgi:soluble lytic murein transglycosylase-like protein